MHAVRWSSAHEGTSGRLCHPERSEGSRWGMARARRTRSLAPLGMTKAAARSFMSARPLHPVHIPTMHLYIHVPFCARRCSYCDFAIAVRRDVPSRRFVSAVLKEWRQWQGHPAWEESKDVGTVYFGGGTPSRLDPGGIAELLAGIGRERQVAAGAEVTLEANPDDV